MCESPSKNLSSPTSFHSKKKKKSFKTSILNIIHDFQGRMAENEDTLEAGRPICKLLKEHKLSKDVGNIDLRNIQEIELKSLGDHQYKTD